MDLVLFGIQGSGKGTQAKKLAEEFGYDIVEMGGVLRSLAASDTETGNIVADHINQGHLVPHGIIMQVLRDVIRTKSKDRPILFDGVPRDADQMRDFDAIMREAGREFHAIHLRVPEELVLERLRKRAREQGRTDDTSEEFIQRRIGWFKEKNMPIIELYAAEGKVTDVDGVGSVDEVAARMHAAVEGM